MKIVDRKRIWHTLVLWVTVLLIAVLTLFVHIPEAKGEPWRMKVTFRLVNETRCAHYVFDTKTSCEASIAWFRTQSAWHGENTYECVLESECPRD